MPDYEWKNKGFSFFQNKNCEFFPCHKGIADDDFNCIFCFCPLYFTGSKCGGNYVMTEDGIKDCSNCTIPHRCDNYGYIIDKFVALSRETGRSGGLKTQKIKTVKLREGARLPVYGTQCSAGADLCACIDSDAVIAPHSTQMIPTGIAVEIPEGYAGLVFARSGLASKRNIAPANKVGVIDSDYRGEIMIALHNHGTEPATISPGERIAQIVITPVLSPEFCFSDELSDTGRGSGGFGSTGTK